MYKEVPNTERAATQSLCKEFQADVLAGNVSQGNLSLAAKIVAGKHEASKILPRDSKSP